MNLSEENWDDELANEYATVDANVTDSSVDQAKNSLPHVGYCLHPKDSVDICGDTEKPKETYDGSEEWKKVFVSNLNFRTSQHDLWEFLESYGSVKSCRILKDNKRRSRGCGIAEYRTREAANQLLKAPYYELLLDGRTLTVRRSIKRFPPRQSGVVLPHSDSSSSTVVSEAVSRLSLSDGDAGVKRGKDDMSNGANGASDSNCSTTTFANLNDDTIVTIFMHLPPKDRIVAERVCRKWKQLMLTVWHQTRRLRIHDFFANAKGFRVMSEANFRKLMKRGFPTLRHLDLSMAARPLSDAAMDVIAQHCPLLTHLDLTGMSLTNPGLEKYCRTKPSLQWISLQDCQLLGDKGIWWVLHECKELTHIDLSGCKRLMGKCLHVLPWHVHSLHMNDCSQLKDVALEKVALRCPELRELHINNCTLLSPAGLNALTQAVTSLQVLQMCGSLVPAEGLLCLGRLSSLSQLHLANSVYVKDDVVQALAGGCSQLRVLNIGGCYEVTAVGVSALANCRLLHTLNINYLHKVTDEAVAAVASWCKLHHLVARGCNGITDAAMVALADHCLQLEELDVSGILALTTASLAAFCKSLTNTSRSLEITIGGTSIDASSLIIPPNVIVCSMNLCQYRLMHDHNLYDYLGMDSDEADGFSGSDDDADVVNGANAFHPEFEDFLDNDDPLALEDFDVS